MTNVLPDPGLSYWPANTSAPLLDLTTGGVLRRAAHNHPQRTALVEVMPEGVPSQSRPG